jgi:hypothetical protein
MPIPEPNKLDVSVRIAIKQSDLGTLGQIELSESFQIDCRDFIGMCKILGQFEELAKKIKAAQ